MLTKKVTESSGLMGSDTESSGEKLSEVSNKRRAVIFNIQAIRLFSSECFPANRQLPLAR
jgi:hypothetical protein